MFNRHVPSAIRESEQSDFDDSVLLNMGHRVIDEFWLEHKSDFVRYSAHKLNLESEIDILSLENLPASHLRTLLKSFMAAEIELRIEPRMTIEQRSKLGALFRNIGDGFLVLRWLAHARFCFSRGAQLFGDLRLHRHEDECWYREGKAALAQTTGWPRAKAISLYIFAGFGYQPYRLLYCCGLTVVLFTLIYTQLEPRWTLFQCFSVSSMNYLSALGYGDVRDSLPSTQLAVILQGFFSLVLNSTLFALLVRRWFRS